MSSVLLAQSVTDSNWVNWNSEQFVHRVSGNKNTIRFEVIREFAKNIVSSNPFLGKSVLICVDEFSLLTDRVKDIWTQEEQRSLINLIHIEKRANGGAGYVQFVLIERMTTLPNSSCPIKSFTLELCDFSSSRPLLRAIRDKYQEHNVKLPLTLFEAVKSTPGVVGMWAQDLFDGHFPNSLVDFGLGSQSVWLKRVVSRD